MSILYICHVWNKTIFAPLCGRNQYDVFTLGYSYYFTFRIAEPHLQMTDLVRFKQIQQDVSKCSLSTCQQGIQRYLQSVCKRSPDMLHPMEGTPIEGRIYRREVSLTVRIPCSKKAVELYLPPQAVTVNLWAREACRGLIMRIS